MEKKSKELSSAEICNNITNIVSTDLVKRM